MEEHHGIITHTHTTRYHYSHCHRCVTLSFAGGTGWTKPTSSPLTALAALAAKLALTEKDQ